MTTTVREQTMITRLHVDTDGTVWLADDVDGPHRAFHCPDVVQIADAARAGLIEVTGQVGNARLLGCLSQSFSETRVRIVDVSACCLPASAAGVLSFLLTDSPASRSLPRYRLCPAVVAAYTLAIGPMDEHRLRHHPAWAAAAYLAGSSGVDCESLHRLLTWWLDPRHHRHAVRFDRDTTLYSRLGLVPSFTDFSRPASPLAMAAFRFWNKGGSSLPACPVLRRAYDRAGPLVAAMRCTQTALSFLRAAWLDQLVSPHPEAPCRVSRFLEADELRAFDALRVRHGRGE